MVMSVANGSFKALSSQLSSGIRFQHVYHFPPAAKPHHGGTKHIFSELRKIVSLDTAVPSQNIQTNFRGQEWNVFKIRLFWSP